jgi:hypothetical protein
MAANLRSAMVNIPARLRTGPTGRPPKIPDSALGAIQQALLEGALAHRFATDVWTLDRIAVVIQGLTGVQLSITTRCTKQAGRAVDMPGSWIGSRCFAELCD